MTDAAQVVLNGLGSGGVYLAAALGLSLIFGVLGILNFAHGELLIAAAYAGSFVLGRDLSSAMASVMLVIALGALVSIVATGALYCGVLRPLAGSSETLPLLGTFAGALVLQGTLIELFGAQPIGIRSDVWAIRLGPVAMSGYRLVGLIVSLAAAAALWAWLHRTRSGREVRAVSEDPVGAASIGVDIGAVRRLAMLVVALLAGLGGLLMVPTTVLTPFGGFQIVLTAFTIVVVAGLGSVPTVVAVSLGLGVLESAVSFYFSNADAPLATYGLLLAILILRPAGLRQTVTGGHR